MDFMEFKVFEVRHAPGPYAAPALRFSLSGGVFGDFTAVL